MNVDFAYQVDGRGRTADAGTSEHLRDLIEQVLMTAPGERVMRPDFGSGLLGLVFEPGGPEAVASTQYLVQGALTQWLGHLITVEAVEVSQVEGTLTIAVNYVVIETQTRQLDEFRRSVA
jgi:phage baseplate assembly protein W